MPQASNITVKNAAGTDVIYQVITPASGDGSTAIWQNKDGLTPKQFRTITAESRRGPSGKTRNLTVRVINPQSYVDPVSGLPVFTPSPVFKLEVTVPDEYPEASRDDFVTLSTSVLSSDMIKSLIRDAYPAT